MVRRRVNMVQRRGIAMLFVLLVSSLVLIGIVTAAGRTIAEKRIVTADYGSKKALSVAESGLEQTVAVLRNATWKGGATPGFVVAVPSGCYITADAAPAKVRSLLMAAPPNGAVSWGGSNPDSRSRFEVKLKKLAGTAWDGTSLPYQPGRVDVEVFVLAEVFSKDGYASQDLLARRVVSGAYSTVVDMGVAAGTSGTSVFDYGLFSEVGISFVATNGNGNGQVHDGGIYSNGSIELGNKTRLDSGYSVTLGPKATVNKDSHNGDTVEQLTTGIPWSVLNVAYYKGLAGQFLTGTGVYDGDPLPDLYAGLSPELKTWVNTALGSDTIATNTNQTARDYRLAQQVTWIGGSTPPDPSPRPAGVDAATWHKIWVQEWSTFVAQLKTVDTSDSNLKTWLQTTLLGGTNTNPTILANPGVSIDAINTLTAAVYATTTSQHVTTNKVPTGLTISQAKWDAFVASELSAVFYVSGNQTIQNGVLKGTIVLDGNLTMQGGTYGSSTDPGLAILVNGSITRGTGNPVFYGLLYATGGVDFGSGNFTVYGSVATHDLMNYSGSFETDYRALSILPYSGITGPSVPTDGGITSVVPLGGDPSHAAWSERTYSNYTDLHT